MKSEIESTLRPSAPNEGDDLRKSTVEGKANPPLGGGLPTEIGISENDIDADEGDPEGAHEAKDISGSEAQVGSDKCSPEANLSDANHGLSDAQIWENRNALGTFWGCPELWRSLDESDISRRLKRSLYQWLELGLPDPVFGQVQGLRSEWVPKFEEWVQSWEDRHSNSPSERPSDAASSAAEETVSGLYELQHTVIEGQNPISGLVDHLFGEIEGVCNAALANALANDKRPLRFVIRVIAGRINVEVQGVPISTPKGVAERFISANPTDRNLG